MQGFQETRNQTFGEIVGNGARLEVPRYQRDYSWGLDQWSDLWEDIEAAVSRPEGWHYLGFVVFQQRDNRDLVVIDGQQRLTTLSLLVLAAMRTILDLGGDDATQRAQTLRASYIGRQDPVTLLTRKKLKLNRNDDQFYSHYLTELRGGQQVGLKASERAMQKAYVFFGERLQRLGAGAAIAAFVEGVANQLHFTSIRVTSAVNAYMVFETLNARGVRLSTADLLKNNLFATAAGDGLHDADLEALESRWSAILASLGPNPVHEFLQRYWSSRYGQVRATKLYRRMRRRIEAPAQVFELLRDLSEEAPVYAALQEPASELWDGAVAVRRSLGTLKLFGGQQYLSLLLAGYRTLDARLFERLARDVVAFAFRYDVVGANASGQQEKLFGAVARRIREEATYQSGWLTPVFPDDQTFRAQFRTWSVPPSNHGVELARYALEQLERQHNSQQVLAGTVKVTVEHILPQSPTADWYDLDDPVWRRAVWRLGNLTLLEKSLNASLGQRRFPAKATVYGQSAFALTREIADDADETWGEREIDRRQNALAKLATVVWRLSGD